MTQAAPFYDGKPCPTCGAALQVVQLYEGPVYSTADYECAGPQPHQWGERTNTLPTADKKIFVKLVPIEDEPQEDEPARIRGGLERID